jgi:putative FmdB family regulatory protein
MIYEYACRDANCGRYDKVVEISVALNKSDSPAFCPECLGRMEKLISKSSFSLKGTGWARDGYGKR